MRLDKSDHFGCCHDNVCVTSLAQSSISLCIIDILREVYIIIIIIVVCI